MFKLDARPTSLHSSMTCPVHLCPETIYFFSVQFILNELNSSYFLTPEILVKISSMESLGTHYSETRKKFRLSQNLSKFF